MAKSNELAGRQALVDAAKQAVLEQGYVLERVPGRGLSSVWNLAQDGKTLSAAIRTTRDRWIAFPPLESGAGWKTLDDVDVVVVAAVDSKERPKNIEVYILQAKDVRQRFDAAYHARKNAGQVIRDDFGMWVGLDPDERGLASSIGSGITKQHEPVAIYPIEAVTNGRLPKLGEAKGSKSNNVSEPEALLTIADVMSWARSRVSEIAGVRIESVKLDLKIEY